MPIRLYYGTKDRVIDPDSVRQFARRVDAGRQPRLQVRPVRSAGHGDQLIGRIPPRDVVAFISAHHPATR